MTYVIHTLHNNEYCMVLVATITDITLGGVVFEPYSAMMPLKSGVWRMHHNMEFRKEVFH